MAVEIYNRPARVDARYNDGGLRVRWLDNGTEGFVPADHVPEAV